MANDIYVDKMVAVRAVCSYNSNSILVYFKFINIVRTRAVKCIQNCFSFGIVLILSVLFSCVVFVFNSVINTTISSTYVTSYPPIVSKVHYI